VMDQLRWNSRGRVADASSSRRGTFPGEEKPKMCINDGAEGEVSNESANQSWESLVAARSSRRE
jgi:hypothetical protein